MSVKPGPLEFGQFYHVYSRGNNRENIFVEEENYAYFLQLYVKYILPVADTYAYCLMRNHFHLLVRIKTLEEQAHSKDVAEGPKDWKSLQPSQQFSNLLNAYAKAMNRRYERSGSLFQSRFGRKIILSDQYLWAVVAYIHRNPQHHHFVTDFRDWPYSSYHALISYQPTRLKREETLRWFSGREQLRDASLRFEEEEKIRGLFEED